MRFDNRRLAVILVSLSLPALAGCRSGPSGSPSADSGSPSSRADTPPAAPAASATVRSDSVLLRTDKSQYKAGERMTLTFENRSAVGYTFNPCQRSIEREDGGTWKPLPDEGRMCTMEAWLLGPHSTGTGPTELPATIPAGRYRVVVRMGVESPGATAASTITAVSDPFTVS
jgi:hypothetical protein